MGEVVPAHTSPTLNPPSAPIRARAPVRVIVEVKGHQHQWLADGYYLEIGHFYGWIACWLADG